MVELHFRSLNESTKIACTAVGRGLLQIGKPSLHVRTEDLGDPLRALEVVDGCLDVIRQVALGLAQILDLRGGSVDAGFEDGVKSQIRIRIRCDGPNLNSHRARVADGHAHHGTAIGGRSLDLVGSFEVRIEPAERIHTGIQDQANIQRAV